MKTQFIPNKKKKITEQKPQRKDKMKNSGLIRVIPLKAIIFLCGIVLGIGLLLAFWLW